MEKYDPGENWIMRFTFGISSDVIGLMRLRRLRKAGHLALVGHNYKKIVVTQGMKGP